MKRRIKSLLGLALLVALLGAGWLAWYAWRPMTPAILPTTLNVTPGTTLRGLAAMLQREGVTDHPFAFRLLGRLTGKGGALKAGVYVLEQPVSPLALYGKLERGEVSQAAVQFIEGWNLREVRAALAAQPLLKRDSAALSEAELAQAIGAGLPDRSEEHTSELQSH